MSMNVLNAVMKKGFTGTGPHEEQHSKGVHGDMRQSLEEEMMTVSSGFQVV